MRVGTRVGPFYASTSTAGCAPWVVSFIILFVIIALVIDHPVAAIVTGVVLVSLIGSAIRRSRARRSNVDLSPEPILTPVEEEKFDDEKWGKVEAAFVAYHRGDIDRESLAAEYQSLTGKILELKEDG